MLTLVNGECKELTSKHLIHGPLWPLRRSKQRNHISPGPLHPASSPVGSSDQSPEQLIKLRSISSVIKNFCGEKLFLIGWAWLPSGWAPAQSCEIR